MFKHRVIDSLKWWLRDKDGFQWLRPEEQMKLFLALLHWETVTGDCWLVYLSSVKWSRTQQFHFGQQGTVCRSKPWPGVSITEYDGQDDEDSISCIGYMIS